MEQKTVRETYNKPDFFPFLDFDLDNSLTCF